jgi:hypothetical protein
MIVHLHSQRYVVLTSYLQAGGQRVPVFKGHGSTTG